MPQNEDRTLGRRNGPAGAHAGGSLTWVARRGVGPATSEGGTDIPAGLGAMLDPAG